MHAEFLILESQLGERIGRYYVTTREPVTVIDICLLRARRANGIGTALITQTLSNASAAGRDVHLHVLQTNIAARKLYERLGFIVEAADAEQSAHFKMSWHPANPSKSR